MLHLLQVIYQRDFLGQLFEMHVPFHPFQVLHRPRLYSHRRPLAMPQQKLTQPMPCSKFIFLLSCPLPGLKPDPATPREPHPAPTPALVLLPDNSVPASTHPADPFSR